MAKTVAFHTLGCKVNQYDTEAVSAQFEAAGYKIVDFKEGADVVVVNTCTVTNIGDRKSRQMVRRAHRKNPGAKIVVMGCFAQTSPQAAQALPGVNLVVGTNDRNQVVELVESLSQDQQQSLVKPIFEVDSFEELTVQQFSGKTRATLKIQDGCNEFCSYCKVPFARGKSRSRQPENILTQISEIAAANYSEVVLTGVHLGAYGKDLSAPLTLTDIVEEISKIDGIKRIRISSIDPHEIDQRFLTVVANNPKVCRHLHVPLQSGCDKILSKMRRKYTTGEYREKIQAARQLIPELAVTTDVIVGFPGESEEDFETTYRFIEEMEFSRLHVFPYSARKGTPASRYTGQLPKVSKDQRSHRLVQLSETLAISFHHKFIGHEMEILFEQVEDGFATGLSDNYIRVMTPSNDPALVGELRKVKGFRGDYRGLEGILL